MFVLEACGFANWMMTIGPQTQRTFFNSHTLYAPKVLGLCIIDNVGRLQIFVFFISPVRQR